MADQPANDPIPFRHRLRVRYNECDPQGVVFNANYLILLDVALTEFLRDRFGAGGGLLAFGADLMMVESRITYRASARADDLIDVEVLVGRLGSTSMRLDARILRGDELLTTAELHYVMIDPVTQRKQPIPAGVRVVLKDLIEAEPA
jgi:acyl-CoA thioester hydrolase